MGLSFGPSRWGVGQGGDRDPSVGNDPLSLADLSYATNDPLG